MAAIEEEILIRKYAEGLYSEALSLTKNEEDAEDVVQMCFEWAVRNHSRRTITHKALLKKCREAAEKVCRYQHIYGNSIDNIAVIQLDPEEVYLHKENAERIKQCIDLVKPRDRKALKLNVVDEIKPFEIARLLGMKPNTVAHKIKRVKKLFKEILIRKGLM